MPNEFDWTEEEKALNQEQIKAWEDEGYYAWKKDVAFVCNPHFPESLPYRCWAKGWQIAEDEYEEYEARVMEERYHEEQEW